MFRVECLPDIKSQHTPVKMSGVSFFCVNPIKSFSTFNVIYQQNSSEKQSEMFLFFF